MKSNKKGFTIVELIIVVAIIAILAAVLIPTFAGVIKSANASADVQAVRNMNTHLAAAKITDGIDSILDVYDLFEDSGFKVKSYSTLVEGTSFFYDKNENKIVYVNDETGEVLYPEEFKGTTQGGHDWYSLNLQIAMKKPSIYTANTAGTAKSITASVSTGEEYAYVINEYNNISYSKNSETVALTITLTADIDAKGANIAIEETKGGDITIQSASGQTYTIKNVTNNKSAFVSNKNASGTYAKYGLAAIISNAGENGSDNNCKASNVTIKDIKFENLNVKGIDTGNVALLIGTAPTKNESITISNVTISSSKVIGHRNTGAIIGYANKNESTSFTVDNVTLNDVKVQYVGGRSGLIGGVMAGKTTLNFTNVVCKRCSLGIYYNEGSYQKVNTVAKDSNETFNYNYTEIGCPAPTSTNTKDKPESYTHDTNTNTDKVIFSVKTFNDNGSVFAYTVLEQNDAAIYVDSGAKEIGGITGVTIN